MLAINGLFAMGKCLRQGDAIVIDNVRHPISNIKKCNEMKLGVICTLLTTMCLSFVMFLTLFFEWLSKKLVFEDIDLVAGILITAASAFYFARYLKYRNWWLLNSKNILLIEKEDSLDLDNKLQALSEKKQNPLHDSELRKMKLLSIKNIALWLISVALIVFLFNVIMKRLNDPIGDRVFESWILITYFAAITSLFIQYNIVKLPK